MKKLLLAFSALVSAALVQAAQLDHWELASSTMTDGEWTFSVNRRDGDGVLPGSDDLYGLQILGCTAFPDHLTTLDFSKPVVYTEGARKYAITNIKPYGDCLSAEAKAVLEHLRLPNHGLGLRINDAFQNCGSLVSVEPFIPSDLVINRGMFQGCVKLSSPLVYKGSSDFTSSDTLLWELFAGTAIPSADLSESLITTLDRACFNGCKSLKTVKLPPTLTTLTGGVAPFSDCAALELVEFNSVPNTLSAFSGCSALKEVRFCHAAPTGTIPAGIYNQLNQDITTYLILDDAETDAISAWAALTAGSELTDTSTWAQNYAGSAALMARRPLLRFSVKHVSLAAGQDGALIAGRPGSFIVSRAEGDPLGGSVMVKYTISGGTAEEGVHFEPLSGIVAIPSGQKSGVIEVSPKYFGSAGTETLTLKLAEGDYEIVEGEDEATISLSTEALRSVSIAKGEDADEGTGTVGFFILSRGEGDSVEGPVNVSLSIGGTAKAGQTYRPISAVVTIPAGEKTLKVKVVPYDDQSVTEDTTVEATILPGGYGIGTDSATVTIANGETYGGWKFIDASHISDGKWTFTVARRYFEVFADGVHELWVQGCTGYPTEPTALDFGKAFHNFYDGTYYMIRQLEMNFGGNAAAAAGVGSVVLPDDPGYTYSILSGCFKNCPNLTSVTPFLPKTCDKLGQNAFGFLPNLVQKDLYFYGSDFGSAEGCWGIIESSTGITNVDLSASTVTVLRRDCFKNCTGLKVVKLPPTIQEFGAPYNSTDPSLYNRSPFNEVGGVKLIFTGGALPVMTCNDGNVSEIEFTVPVAELSDNAFYSYFNPYGSTLLKSIIFVGEPPATIGENVFSGSNGGFAKESVTVFVPNYYRAEWREIADNGKLTKKDGGTWTSGTKQLLATYGESRQGILIIVK